MKHSLAVAAVLVVASATALAQLNEGFEAYPLGPLAPQGGWAIWYSGGDNGTIVANPAHAGQRALRYDLPGMTQGGTDITQTWNNIQGGQWVFKAWTYVPTAAGGISNEDGYLILMNQYTSVSGIDNWSMQVRFSAAQGLVESQWGLQTTALIYDQWIELRADIDLVLDKLDIYYNGVLFAPNLVWTNNTSGGGLLQIECLDLYSDSVDGMFVDDVSLQPAGGPGAGDGDLNCDGVINAFDIDAFVKCLTTGTPTPPCPDCQNADINDDGVINAFDIDPFVVCLTTGVC